MGLEIEGAMQQAPQAGRQFMGASVTSPWCDFLSLTLYNPDLPKK
jgi:hypothetical protein